MKNPSKYLLANIENDARIVIPFADKVSIIYPAFVNIKTETAKKIIIDLNLIWVPSYKDCKNHPIGSAMYVFKENFNKY